MEMMILIAAVPVLAVVLAALSMAGQERRKAGRDARPVILAGRVLGGGVLVGLLFLLWRFSGSPGGLEGGLLLVSAVLILVFMVSEQWAPKARMALLGSFLAVAGTTWVLHQYEEGGWQELGRQVGIQLAIFAGCFAVLRLLILVLRARKGRAISSEGPTE